MFCTRVSQRDFVNCVLKISVFNNNKKFLKVFRQDVKGSYLKQKSVL